MTEDPGVMGNLPRARPGRRSEKRATGGAPKQSATAARSKPRGSAGTSSRAKSAAGRSAAAKGTAPKAAATSRQRPPKAEASPTPASERGGDAGSFDPVGDAVRVAGKVAGAGLKVAGGVLKRLPGR